MTNKLAEWLKDTGTARKDFAEAIGVSPAYVTLLCSEKPAWPGRDVITRIREVTKGAVVADDFLSAPDAPRELQDTGT